MKRNPSFYFVYEFHQSYENSIKIVTLWDSELHQKYYKNCGENDLTY